MGLLFFLVIFKFSRDQEGIWTMTKKNVKRAEYIDTDDILDIFINLP